MNHSIIDLLIKPGAFFQNAMNEKESMKFPALIVLAGGIAGALYGYLIGGLTGQLMSAIMPGMDVIIALEYIPRIHVPQLSAASAQNPDLITEAVNALMHDPAMMELSQITMIISMVFLLWSANIWIFGMQHSRNLSPRDAALCVGIPVVLYILYMVYSITVM